MWASCDSRCSLCGLHVLRAELHVAAIVDQSGSRAVNAEESYWHHATGGTFSLPDLQLGEDFLCTVGLLVDVNGTLMPRPRSEICSREPSTTPQRCSACMHWMRAR
jgi:hypothetical protein